jgi:hypothetical protein
LTHQALIREHTIDPQASRNGIDLFREGAGEPGAVWRPFQIVSLLEMYHFSAGVYRDFFEKVRDQFDKIALLCEERGNRATLTSLEAKELTSLLGFFRSECEKSNFKRPLDRFHKFNTLAAHPQAVDVETIKWELKELLEAAVKEGLSRKFFVLEEGETNHFNLKHAFGEAVYTNFESTRHDVREAKNCFILDRYTACVFHSMRVVEKGLHALVHDLNSKFGAAIIFNKDIEYMNWGNIIDKTEKEIGKLLDPSRKPPLVPDELKFYSEAGKEFVYFKNAWRDDVAHSRSSYSDVNETKAIMNHVEAFMRKLATKLKE